MFGYSISSDVFGGDRLIIGAPFQNESGVAYICSDSSSCLVDDPASMSAFIPRSMYGATNHWINSEEYISCQPRFHVMHWCNPVLHQCVESPRRPGPQWLRQMFVTGRCYIKNERRNTVHIFEKCDYDEQTAYAKMCTSKGAGFSLAMLDSSRLVVSNPLNRYQQGSIGLISGSRSPPQLTSTSATFDDFFTSNPAALHKLPRSLFPTCGGESEDERNRCRSRIVANFDHSHFGMALAAFGSSGLLVGSPHRYRTQLAGSVSFYPVRGEEVAPFEQWFLDSSRFVDGRQMGELFGWSVAVGDFNNDGHLDVAIGAPTWSKKNEVNLGRVYIFIGPNKEDRWAQYVAIQGTHPGKQFGASLFIKDVDNGKNYV